MKERGGVGGEGGGIILALLHFSSLSVFPARSLWFTICGEIFVYVTYCTFDMLSLCNVSLDVECGGLFKV